MNDKERVVKEKYKSGLFKGIAGWCTRHGAVLAAIMLIAVSAVLGTFETQLVYGGASLSYGQNGTTSSPTYKGGSGNNPTAHEPGVIGVSVVTYNMNRMGNSGLKYGTGKDKGKGNNRASSVSSTNKLEDINKAIDAYGENEGASVWKKNNGKDYGYYPYWTRVGYTKKGEPIYTYSNVLKHAITQNMLSMQTARSFNESTLVFVPEAVASSNHLSWIKNLNQHVIGKSTKNSNKFAIFYDLNPSYKDTDSADTKYASTLKKLHSRAGIYYWDLKSYLKKHEKKKTGKEFLEIIEVGKKYDVCNYSRFSEIKKKSDLDAIIGYKKNSKGKYEFTSTGKEKLKDARMLYSSAVNIAEPKKNSYISTPEIFLIFLRSTTAIALGNKIAGTQTFSWGGWYEGIYGPYGKGNKEHTNGVYSVSEAVIRNLFTTDENLEKNLDREALNYKSMRSQLKREVLNNEYNTHYLDLLFCGYALARASGDTDAVTKWSDAIFAYAGSAGNDSESMKNVVIRLDTGMVYGTSKDITFASTGSIINKHYGLSTATAYEENKITNKKSLSKGFIGFAAHKDNTKQNYQARNQEIASGKGVVKASDYSKTYGDYYTRLENAINSTGVAVNSDSYSWYGTMMAARATTKEYFKSSKNKKATSKVANKLSVVSLLKMKASPYGATSTSTKEWNYGTYAVDGYAWKDVTEQDSVKFNLAIYSTKANKKAPSTNGKNIKDTFQSVTVDVTGDNSTVTDDVYVKLTPDKDKDSKALFAKMLSSNKYYVKVVFEDGTGKTVKTLDGKSSKTVKEIKGGSTSQQKKYAAALNQYDDTNKGSEKGDEQNYNKLVSAKQIGGKDLQTNKCLIWRISNSKVRTDGFKISEKNSKYVNWKAKVYIYKKSGSGASAIWTNVLSGKQVKGKTVKAADMGNGDYTETNSVIAQYIGKESDPEDDKDVNLSGTYESTPEAYAELKEGSVYNETFEAMAGTPSTRSLYFATGGSEFIVNMQAVYDDYNLDEVGGNKNSYRSTRTYKSIFKKVDCEYKKGDTLKSLAAGKGRETKKKKERAVSSPF